MIQQCQCSFTSWFHIRIHNRKSLKYNRLPKNSWKIHKLQGFLFLMLLQSFKPENFAYTSAIFSKALARGPHKNSRLTSLNNLCRLNHDWRQRIFFLAQFCRQFFLGSKTTCRAEKTGCSRRLLVLRVQLKKKPWKTTMLTNQWQKIRHFRGFNNFSNRCLG